TALPVAAAAVEEAGHATQKALARMQTAREAADAARRAEAEAGAAIREAGREEDSAAVEMERLELRRTGLGERAALAAADLADARSALAEAERVAAALPDADATEAK